jgi:hypothetical protein
MVIRQDGDEEGTAMFDPGMGADILMESISLIG